MKYIVFIIFSFSLLGCKYFEKKTQFDENKVKYFDSYEVYTLQIRDDIKFKLDYCDSLRIKQKHNHLFIETIKVYEYINEIIDSLNHVEILGLDCQDDSDQTEAIMIGEHYDKLARDLHMIFDSYSQTIINDYQNKRINWIINSRHDYHAYILDSSERVSWESLNFELIPLIAAKYRLFAIQNELLTTMLMISFELGKK
jgi:hypothetical protein